MENKKRLDKKFADEIIEWFSENARELPFRKDQNAYRVLVSEIMLQQTRVDAVLSHYARFMKELPSIEALAAVADDKLHKLWEGLGYYTRAKNLKKTAIIIRDVYHGIFPNSYDEIIKLPGVGVYTAGAIASICFDAPTPAVDGNVLRVITRYLGLFCSISEDKTKKEITEVLKKLYTPQNARQLTEGLMEIGALLCLPNGTPRCDACPLQSACAAHAKKLWDKIPVKRQKKPRRKERKTVLLLKCGDRFAIYKRESRGLLSGMYALPDIPSHLAEDEVLCVLTQWGLHPSFIQKGKRHTHIFTHVEWEIISYVAECETASDQFLWKTKAEIQDAYALPTAFRVFLSCM